MKLLILSLIISVTSTICSADTFSWQPFITSGVVLTIPALVPATPTSNDINFWGCNKIDCWEYNNGYKKLFCCWKPWSSGGSVLIWRLSRLHKSITGTSSLPPVCSNVTFTDVDFSGGEMVLDQGGTVSGVSKNVTTNSSLFYQNPGWRCNR
jgi:hypothetical protein